MRSSTGCSAIFSSRTTQTSPRSNNWSASSNRFPRTNVRHAALAARGAYSAVRIPQTELRAAIVRAARRTEKQGLYRDGVAEQAAALVGCALATDERRSAARTWVERLAEGSAAHTPFLADALLTLAAESAATEADSDLIWIQAGVGLTLEAGLAMS